MRRIYVALAVMAVALLTTFATILRGKDLDMMGTYRTYAHETYDEDAVRCDVGICSTETFGPFGVRAAMDVEMTFRFDGAVEFNDLTLRYNAGLSGDWHTYGDRLTLSSDTSSFSYTFAGSSASSNVEEAMVRQLRKFVDVSLVPKIRRKAIKTNSRTLTVVRRTAERIETNADGEEMVLERQE